MRIVRVEDLMQVISRRALRDFWSLHPQARDPLLAWLKLIALSEYPDFEGLHQTFSSVKYVSPHTIFRIGACDSWLVAVVHYSRRRVFVRHVMAHMEYELWLTKVSRRRAVEEPLQEVAYAMDSAFLARVASSMSREVVLHYERTSWPGDERLHE